MANRLEKSLQQGRELLASYENRLTQDDTMPESGHMLDSKKQELEVSLGSGSHGVFSQGSAHLPPPPDEDVMALKVQSIQHVNLGVTDLSPFHAQPWSRETGLSEGWRMAGTHATPLTVCRR